MSGIKLYVHLGGQIRFYKKHTNVNDYIHFIGLTDDCSKDIQTAIRLELLWWKTFMSPYQWVAYIKRKRHSSILRQQVRNRHLQKKILCAEASRFTKLPIDYFMEKV